MRRETESTVERMERDNDRADEAYERSKGDDMNAHVAEPFRSALAAMGGGNMFELAARSERLAIDLARKQMCNDVLRVLVESKHLSCAQSIQRVVALCAAEARK